jgi:hypothetical protein
MDPTNRLRARAPPLGDEIDPDCFQRFCERVSYIAPDLKMGPQEFLSVIESGLPSLLEALPDTRAIEFVTALIDLDSRIAELLISIGLFERLTVVMAGNDSEIDSQIAGLFTSLISCGLAEAEVRALELFLEIALKWAIEASSRERQIQAIDFLGRALPAVSRAGLIEKVERIGPLVISLFNATDLALTECALMCLNNLIRYSEKLDFCGSFDFLRIFWEEPFIGDMAIRSLFLELFALLMVLFKGMLWLLEYVNWELLMRFAAEESTSYLANCILHQMTCDEPVLQCALEHGILEVCQRVFAGAQYRVTVIALGLMKNVLFVATAEQLKWIMVHNVLVGLFCCLGECSRDLAAAVLAAVERALGVLSVSGALMELVPTWERLGIFAILREIGESDQLVEKAEVIFDILGYDR